MGSRTGSLLLSKVTCWGPCLQDAHGSPNAPQLWKEEEQIAWSMRLMDRKPQF